MGTWVHGYMGKNGKIMYELNDYKQKIRIKKKKLDWLKENRNKAENQSIAAFLDEILDEKIKPNLFNRKKNGNK